MRWVVQRPVVGEKDACAVWVVGAEFGGESFGCGLGEDEGGAWCVVADAYSGGWEGCRGCVGFGGLVGGDHDAGGGGDLGCGDGSGAVEDHRGLRGVEDGGFQADGGGAGVEDGVDARR